MPASEIAKTASRWVSAGGLLATLTWFGVYEFAQKNKPETAYLFDEQTALMLDSAREIAGIPFVINSAVREPDYIDSIGGAARSSHTAPCYCAVDISAKNKESQDKIISALRQVGFTRFVIYPRHIHVDSDSTKPSGTWYRGYK